MPKSGSDDDNIHVIMGGGSWVVAAWHWLSLFLPAPKGHLLATCEIFAIIPEDVLLARAITTPAEMAGGVFR